MRVLCRVLLYILLLLGPVVILCGTLAVRVLFEGTVDFSFFWGDFLGIFVSSWIVVFF